MLIGEKEGEIVMRERERKRNRKEKILVEFPKVRFDQKKEKREGEKEQMHKQREK